MWQASTCKSPRAAERRWRQLVYTGYNWYAQVVEVLRSSLMATFEDDRTELVDDDTILGIRVEFRI